MSDLSSSWFVSSSLRCWESIFFSRARWIQARAWPTSDRPSLMFWINLEDTSRLSWAVTNTAYCLAVFYNSVFHSSVWKKKQSLPCHMQLPHTDTPFFPTAKQACSHYLTSCSKDPLRGTALSSSVLWSEPLDPKQATSSPMIRQLLTCNLDKIDKAQGLCSNLTETQLVSLSSPVPPGSEADGTKEQTSPVQNKHTYQYSLFSCSMFLLMCIL